MTDVYRLLAVHEAPGIFERNLTNRQSRTRNSLTAEIFLLFFNICLIQSLSRQAKKITDGILRPLCVSL